MIEHSRGSQVNLKCDPEWAIELREEYDGTIISGFHMSKKHWNSVSTQGAVPDKQLYQLIDHSYDLVVESFTKKLQRELKEL